LTLPRFGDTFAVLPSQAVVFFSKGVVMRTHPSSRIRLRSSVAVLLSLSLLLTLTVLFVPGSALAAKPGDAAQAASNFPIYTNGTENVPITGGYEDSVVTQREKRADHLWMWAEMPALRVQTSWTTGQAIDLTGISKVAVEWANVGTAGALNESYLVAATNSTDRAEDQALKFSRTSSFGITIDRLDVSGLNQSRYIRVHARDADAGPFSGLSSELNVYRIWLEPDPSLLEVNVSADPSIGGTVSESGHYFMPGASATVNAVAATNYAFVNWTEGGSVVSTSASYNFTVDHNTNLVANFTVSEKRIYWNGTEYWPITGGFQDMDPTGLIPLAQREKRADHLWIYAEMPMLRVQAAWTTQAIDLTDISTVAVEWENVGDNDPANESYLVAATNGTDVAEGQADKLQRTRSFGRRVDRFDVSSINEPRFIRVHARDASNSDITGISSELNVYKIWLEPPSSYEVNVSASPSVGGTVAQSDHVFRPGTSATVTAAAAANYEFVDWTVGASEVSTTPSYTFPVNDNRNLVAHFRLAQKKIYWNGTEYFPIIGGYNDAVVTQRDKKSDHLWMWSQMPMLRVQTSWTTQQAIDLTNIGAVAVEWENVGTSDPANESYLVAGTNNTDRAEDQTDKLQVTGSFSRKVSRFYVGGINEPRYIRVHARDASNTDVGAGISSELNVYRIWLEPVGVKSIAPASAVEGTANVPVTLMGAAFVDGATVRIQNTSKTVNATNVVVVSPNKITCSLDLTGAPLGKYDVIVRNPSGDEGVLGQGFSITNICGGGAAIGLSVFGVMMGFLSLAGVGFGKLRRKK
jgi:Divergent InlB B-repeat domain